MSKTCKSFRRVYPWALILSPYIKLPKAVVRVLCHMRVGACCVTTVLSEDQPNSESCCLDYLFVFCHHDISYQAETCPLQLLSFPTTSRTLAT